MPKLLMILLAAVALLLATLGLVSWHHGFPLALMDLDDSGFISPLEVLKSLDLGHRPASGGEGTCTEIFQLKDGMPVKIVCNAL